MLKEDKYFAIKAAHLSYITSGLVSVKAVLEYSKEVSPELAADSITKLDLIGYHGLTDLTYDFALPQPDVDAVMEKLNFNMAPHFVYIYSGCYEGPLPITHQGNLMVPVINHVMKWGLKKLRRSSKMLLPGIYQAEVQVGQAEMTRRYLTDVLIQVKLSDTHHNTSAQVTPIFLDMRNSELPHRFNHVPFMIDIYQEYRKTLNYGSQLHLRVPVYIQIRTDEILRELQNFERWAEKHFFMTRAYFEPNKLMALADVVPLIDVDLMTHGNDVLLTVRTTKTAEVIHALADAVGLKIERVSELTANSFIRDLYGRRTIP